MKSYRKFCRIDNDQEIERELLILSTELSNQPKNYKKSLLSKWGVNYLSGIIKYYGHRITDNRSAISVNSKYDSKWNIPNLIYIRFNRNNR